MFSATHPFAPPKNPKQNKTKLKIGDTAPLSSAVTSLNRTLRNVNFASHHVANMCSTISCVVILQDKLGRSSECWKNDSNLAG